ncbi:TraX family protein [Furfurilactobacillus sp. WILCCON 0119]
MKTRKLSMNGFSIKVLGIILMVLDHIHEELLPLGIPTWFNMLGRIVAPLFLFLSVEGFIHTHNRKRYLWRLLLGFWIMALGSFLLQTFLPVDNGRLGLLNNIFGTLFLGVFAMLGISKIADGRQDHDWRLIWQGIGILSLEVLLSVIGTVLLFIPDLSIRVAVVRVLQFIPNIIATEGGPLFVLLAVLFYLFRNNRRGQIASLAIVSLIFTGFNFHGLFSTNYAWMMIGAIIPIALYNGQRGRSDKWFFYVFYPTHIWVLYLLAFALHLTGY